MKVLSAILCDEVRKEDTGKLLFIGVYTSDILVKHFPTPAVNLAFWLHLGPLGKNKINMALRIYEQSHPKLHIYSGNGTISIQDRDRDVFVTLPISIANIPGPTTLLFDIKIDNSRWKKVYGIKVEHPQ